MIEYSMTATLTYSTNVKPELGLEQDFRKNAKDFIRQEGIDAFLDRFEYGNTLAHEVDEEELEALIESGDIVVSIESLKETLNAVALGILELGDMTPEQAIQTLERFEQRGI